MESSFMLTEIKAVFDEPRSYDMNVTSSINHCWKSPVEPQWHQTSGTDPQIKVIHMYVGVVIEYEAEPTVVQLKRTIFSSWC